MKKDYFKNKPLNEKAPQGNFLMQQKWPEIGQQVLWSGNHFEVIKLVKKECSVHLKGSLGFGKFAVGLNWVTELPLHQPPSHGNTPPAADSDPGAR